MAYNTLYPNSSVRKELDLRQEINRLLYGASDEIAKGRIGLLRKMRRDSNNELVRCSCRDLLTDEPDKDYYCRSCLGSGFLWDEWKIVYYRNDDSFTKYKGKNQEYSGDDFFIEYNKEITSDDYIILVNLNSEGKVVYPVKRVVSFKILKATPFRSDEGRIEFWQVRAKEERKWSLWYGVPIRR